MWGSHNSCWGFKYCGMLRLTSIGKWKPTFLRNLVPSSSWSSSPRRVLYRIYVLCFSTPYGLCSCGISCGKLIHTIMTVDSSWNVMAHGDAREGKWRGNWRMEWVANTLHITSQHGASSITIADSHISAASSRLNWRPPADLNGLVRFTERRNLVSARVPSRFNRPILAIWNAFSRACLMSEQSLCN